MTWMHSSGIHEVHGTPHSTNRREPPSNELPLPSSDEEAIGQGNPLCWGENLGRKKNDTIHLVFQNINRIPREWMVN